MVTDAAEARQMVDTWDAEELPLGGKGALNSGYKGYGLALGVEILSSCGLFIYVPVQMGVGITRCLFCYDIILPLTTKLGPAM